MVAIIVYSEHLPCPMLTSIMVLLSLYCLFLDLTFITSVCNFLIRRTVVFFCFLFVYFIFGMWDLISPARDHTCAPYTGNRVATTGPLGKSVQFSLVTQLCPTLCDPMDCSTPGFPVHHQLLELAQTLVHWVGDAIQPSHPVVPFSSHLPSFPASGSFPVSRSLHQVAKVLEFQLQHQSFQWIFRVAFL